MEKSKKTLKMLGICIIGLVIVVADSRRRNYQRKWAKARLA